MNYFSGKGGGTGKEGQILREVWARDRRRRDWGVWGEGESYGEKGEEGGGKKRGYAQVRRGGVGLEGFADLRGRWGGKLTSR